MSKVQMWNPTIMMGLIEYEEASKMVASGKWKWINSQAIIYVGSVKA